MMSKSVAKPRGMGMNINFFKERLKANNINPDRVCFNDNITDDIYCVLENYHRIEVFYRERGNWYEYGCFPTQEAAVQYLIGIMKNCVFNRTPDVRVRFEFNGSRSHPAWNGYRPAHLVKENYLTSGVHHYFDVEKVESNGAAEGTITFITPEAYPHCLWTGKRINIQEGGRVVGTAVVLEIYNGLLEVIDERSV